jgi:hypothetical protein
MESVNWNIKFPFICTNNPSLSKNIIVPEYEAEEMTLESLQQKLIIANLKIHIWISFREPIFPSDLNIADNRDIFPILFKQEKDSCGPYQIFVRNYTGKDVAFFVSNFNKIEDLGAQIEDKIGIPKNIQKLTFAGKLLENGRTLCDYNIQKDSTINLTTQILGGGEREGSSFVDISNTAGKKEKGVGFDGPDYLTICCGLNIEGKCTNSLCRANGKTVIHQVGMHVFDLILQQHNVKCPICKKWIKPVTCGFYKCEYKYTGIKKERASFPPIKVHAPAWTKTSPTKYEYYDPRKSRVVQWINLKILTRDFTGQSPKTQSCGICQEKIGGAGRKCGHIYHKHCIHALPKVFNFKGGCLFCGLF